MTTEVMEGFSPGVVNRLCVTHKKNLEQQKCRNKEPAKVIIFLFSKLTVKVTDVNSNSWWET